MDLGAFELFIEVDWKAVDIETKEKYAAKIVCSYLLRKMQVRLASFWITNPKSTNLFKEKVTIILVGIPSMKFYGEEGEYRVMIIELLGPSLDDLQFYCKGKFSLKTVLIIADQLVI